MGEPETTSILVVAGEASADAHAAQVLRSLRETSPALAFFGIGGQACRGAGLEAVANAEDMAVAGLTEVVGALPRIWGIMKRLEREALRRRPKAALLVDLPDFNLRLARKLKQQGVQVIYYVSPQIWAWRSGRVKQIKKYVDRMLVILPFEVPFYKRFGVPVEFVGHPLVEEVGQATPSPGNRDTVALLPGSRRSEIQRHFPRMLAALRLARETKPDLKAIVPVASTIDPNLVKGLVEASGTPCEVSTDDASETLCRASVAVVCSGTATLQTALLDRPMLVVYRVSFLTFWLLRWLVRIDHIALVNLIAQRRLVPELVQGKFTPKALGQRLLRLMASSDERDTMHRGFAEIRTELGNRKPARRVAEVVLSMISTQSEPRVA